MVVRTLQFLVFGFWLFTMGALLKAIYSPDEAGFVELDVRRPAQNFFQWNDSTRMTLYQDQRKLGRLSVVAFEKTNDSQPGFSLSTTLTEGVDPQMLGAFTSALFKFKDDFTLSRGSFIFKLPSRQLVAQIHTDSDDQLTASVKMGEETLFDYQGSKEGSPNPAMLGMLQANPMAGGLFAALNSGGEGQWQEKIKAYRGKHRVNSRRLPVYLFKIEPTAQQEIRIYFTESGEPLVIETSFGIYAISEVLEVEPRR